VKANISSRSTGS